MLKHAIELARQGRAVYVIASNKRDADGMRGWYRANGFTDETLSVLEIKIETPRSIVGFDYEKMTMRGAYPNSHFLVDHHANLLRFWRILEMYHAYDPPLFPHQPPQGAAKYPGGIMDRMQMLKELLKSVAEKEKSNRVRADPPKL